MKYRIDSNNTDNVIFITPEEDEVHLSSGYKGCTFEETVDELIKDFKLGRYDNIILFIVIHKPDHPFNYSRSATMAFSGAYEPKDMQKILRLYKTNKSFNGFMTNHNVGLLK